MNTKQASLDVIRQLSKVKLAEKTARSKKQKPEPKKTLPVKNLASDKPQSRKDNANQLRAAQSRIFSDHSSKKLAYDALEVPDQPPVPRLANQLDRVLFNGGVNFLKDPRTNVYNFDNRLEKIMSIADFDFSRIPPYVPAGRDSRLSQLAAKHQFRYTGSTSSMTSVLTQLHHALSHMRPPQILKLSKYFPGRKTSFTATQKAPTSFWLRKSEQENVFAITQPTSESRELILTLLGHSMEVMLTTGCTEFEGYNKTASKSMREPVQGSSTYNFTSCGPFLMRSQLDCYDPRLPGTGMFDLKTRACCAIRHDVDYAQIHDGSDYHILKLHGQYESFEREYFELVRSALFKYSLQARIGRMDGIFVAYHSVRRLFGFEYLPLTEIDKVFHTAQVLTRNSTPEAPGGDSEDTTSLVSDPLRQYDLEQQLDIASHIADAEFKLSVHLLGDLLDEMCNNVLKDAQALFTGPAEEYPTDINFVVHCKAAGSLVVLVRPGVSTQPNMLSMSEPPSDLRAFSIDLKQYIDNTPVDRTQYPSLENTEQDWRVRASIYEFDKASSEELFEDAVKSKVSQVLTSEPHTEEQPTQEIIDEMLRNLPEASPFQKILRAFEKKGHEYSKWDSGRPKHQT